MDWVGLHVLLSFISLRILKRDLLKGALGIVTLKNLLEEGFAVTGFEKHDSIGGLWRFTDASQTSTLECEPRGTESISRELIRIKPPLQTYLKKESVERSSSMTWALTSLGLLYGLSVPRW